MTQVPQGARPAPPMQGASTAVVLAGTAAPKPRRVRVRKPRQGVTAKCGARARQTGNPCRNVAGYRTNHVGTGRCYLHGGATPIRHGRFSKITRPRLRELVEEFEKDPDPLNILPEIALMRGLLVDFIERYDANSEALIAWFEDYRITKRPPPEQLLLAFESVVTEYAIHLRERGDPTDHEATTVEEAQKFIALLRRREADDGKPRQVLDVADAHRILAEIGKMVERVEKIRNANAISRPELNRIMQEQWRSVDARIADSAVKASIREDWLRIAL